jgi:hypothetical protein
MHYTPASFVIKRFGGVRATARALGRSPSAISRWHKTGRVPGGAMALVLKVADKKGLKIRASDLIFGGKARG